MYERPMRASGYRQGGEEDTGWGCVYRSAQNVQLYLHVPMWSVKRLTRALKRPWGTWSEPADYVPIFRKQNLHARAHLLGGPSRRWLQYTSADQYAAPVPPKDFVWKTDRAYIVDDGISGYAIVPWRGSLWWIDPHTQFPKPRPFTHKIMQYSTSKGWMVCEVWRSVCGNYP